MNLEAKQWRAMINGSGTVVPPGTGQGGLELCVVLDATRNVYNKLLVEFSELAHETSELWNEVKHLREWRKSALNRFAVDRERFSALHSQVDELERTAHELRSGVQPKSGFSFMSADKVQCRAVPEWALAQSDHKRADLEKQLVDRVPRSWLNASTERGNELEKQIAALKNQLVDSKPPKAEPVSYGVDFGENDKTVITVRQGDKVLHTIDLEVERTKERWRQSFTKPYGRVVFPSLGRQWGRWTYGGWPAFDNWREKVERDIKTRNEARRLVDYWQQTRPKNSMYNHNTRWSKAQDDGLLHSYMEGLNLRQIAEAKAREWEAVLYRLARLAKWPERWTAHEKFLNFAWMWFFKPTGASFSTAEMRQMRFGRLPRGGVFGEWSRYNK